MPRVLAATLSLPALIAIGDSIGILGYLVGINRLDFSSSTYLASTASMLQISDISSGIIKGVFLVLLYLYRVVLVAFMRRMALRA